MRRAGREVVYVGIRMPAELQRGLRLLADQEMTDLSSVCRRLLAAGLKMEGITTASIGVGPHQPERDHERGRSDPRLAEGRDT